MRNRFTKLLITAVTSMFSWRVWAVPQHVLITAFEPFGIADVNRSIDTAKAIQEKLARANIIVDICILPVVYDLASEKAKDCYQKMNPKPTVVLSLGEGDCSVRIETAAHNRDSSPGFLDNAGQMRTGQLIEKAGPSSVAFRSFVMDMYCAQQIQVRNNIKISESPGGFVCNNTAFHLGVYFEKLGLPYTFIHVPSQACSSDDSMAKSAGNTIADMLKSLPQFENRSHFDFEKICRRLPTTVKQVENFEDLLQHLSPSQEVSCGTEFNERLKERLLQWHEKNSTY